MSEKLQNAVVDAAGVIGSLQWALAMVARHGRPEYARIAVQKLEEVAAELQAALDEVKE